MATVTLNPNTDLQIGGSTTWDGVGYSSGIYEVTSDADDGTYLMPGLEPNHAIVGYTTSAAIHPPAISKIELLCRCWNNTGFDVRYWLRLPNGTDATKFTIASSGSGMTTYTGAYTDEATLRAFRSISAINDLAMGIAGTWVEGYPQVAKLSVTITYDPQPIVGLGVGF